MWKTHRCPRRKDCFGGRASALTLAIHRAGLNSPWRGLAADVRPPQGTELSPELNCAERIAGLQAHTALSNWRRSPKADRWARWRGLRRLSSHPMPGSCRRLVSKAAVDLGPVCVPMTGFSPLSLSFPFGEMRRAGRQVPAWGRGLGEKICQLL